MLGLFASKDLISDIEQKLNENFIHRPGIIAWTNTPDFIEIADAMGIELFFPVEIMSGKNFESLRYEIINTDKEELIRIDRGKNDIYNPKVIYELKPDFIVIDNLGEKELKNWLLEIHRTLNIPAVYFGGDEEQKIAKDDALKMMAAVLDRIHEITGLTIDGHSLKEAIKTSDGSAMWWHKIINTGKDIPSPANGYDILRYLDMTYKIKARHEGKAMLMGLYQELEDLSYSGKGEASEEKHRIVFVGDISRTEFAALYVKMKASQMKVVHFEGIINEPSRYVSYNMDGLADAYVKKYNKRYVPESCSNLNRIVREYAADGIIIKELCHSIMHDEELKVPCVYMDELRDNSSNEIDVNKFARQIELNNGNA